MDLVPVAGAIAGATAAAAYIDAKFHITKDLQAIRRGKASEKEFARQGGYKRGSLWHFFEEQVHRLPETEEAIWSREGCYTWGETYAQACRYSQFFRQHGVKTGEFVSLYLTNQPEFVFAVLGSWGVGSAPALINHHLAGDALIHCLKVAGGKILIVDEASDARERIEAVRDRIEGELGMTIQVLDKSLKGEICRLEPKRPEDELRKGLTGTFPMCLFYTSGTTGHPKACPFESQRAGGLAGGRIRDLGLQPGPNGDRWYVCMPLYHGTGYTTAVSCLLSGITLCIGKKFSTSRFWTEVRESRSTAFVYVGETARYLLANPPSPDDKKHNVKVMFGNGMRPDVWHRFVDRFGIPMVAEFFNSTEGVFALMNVSEGPYSATAVGHHGAIMRSRLKNTFIPVEIDHETNEIWRDPKTGFAKRRPYEEGGEIIVQLPNEKAFVGYHNNEKATQSKFERNVFRKGDLFYRTGDALRRTPDGLWYFMDRLGDTFRWKSENVSTAEVSEVLGNFPGVVEANVYGVEVPGHDGRAGCAALYIDPAQKDSFDFNALLRHSQEKLPKYAVPVFLRVLNNITTMHNNKQNKVPLRNDGCDLRKLIERTDKEASEKGLAAGDVQYDTFYWCPASLSNVKGAQVDDQGYVVFTLEDSDGLRKDAQTARL
ncbi:fatty acid transporter-like protein [Aaosphaeria arxii CBS 175.79]|uniref:Very long-chain fatty acid transport protein n=1 Tax=Aaosphaeria arxii CBS 175.79 TaxID=1450172 RepID=A0A6A5XW59_9PLEO|nr:fatty acid transporter-like protein [Aaosphaeria arxii CBS 175.79]KAF2017209.1 fatty acid transporter-like protein [Aaosphaeria arxii CBS 175.79]